MILKKKKRKRKKYPSMMAKNTRTCPNETRCLIYFKTKRNELKNRRKLQRTIEVVAKLKLQIISYYN